MKHNKLFATLITGFVVFPAICMGYCEAQRNRQILLDAICSVESNCDPSKVGDKGELGCYQIRECFWIDALEHDPSIGGEYEDVIDKEYAEKCIYAYWDRYATEKRLGRPVTDEDRARMHNGGPNGHKKDATVKYWNKIEKELND